MQPACVRVAGGTALGVGDLHRRARRADDRDLARRAARRTRRRPIRRAGRGRRRCVLADNRFPDFVRPICRGGARARHPGRARRRQADQLERSAVRASPRMSSSRRKACARRPVEHDLAAGSANARRSDRRRSSRSPTARRTCCGSRAARCARCRRFRSRRSTRSAPATSSTAPSRWRWPKAATQADRHALRRRRGRAQMHALRRHLRVPRPRRGRGFLGHTAAGQPAST